jgi:hypothetical protein
MIKTLSKTSGRYWVIGGVALILAVVLGANAHLLYVAFSSQPGCAEATMATGADGSRQLLQPAKGGC